MGHTRWKCNMPVRLERSQQGLNSRASDNASLAPLILGLVAGTREIVVHPNYVVIYRVTISSIEIINVLHSRQQYP